MKIQVQFTCPVGVIVDTDTGKIDSVHVWNEDLDTTAPTGAYRSSGPHSLPLDHPEVVKAREVIAGDEEWPGWQFS
jgi:hypothetical protein